MAVARRSAIRDPKLRAFTTRVLLEYRRTGSAATNENLKHVLRMAREVRSDQDNLRRIGCDPAILEAAILLSDLGKEPHVIERYRSRYGGSPFRAFLDHSRTSMIEGNRIRREVGLDARVWRSILGSIIGHDGPSTPGSWWKTNYERELGKRYPMLHSRDALIHCYLDRIDQGGIFRSRNGCLDGGLKKISYDIFTKDGAFRGNLGATIFEIFHATRVGTQEQLDYLDEVEKPRLLGTTPLPSIIREMKRKFVESERYSERVLIDESNAKSVRIVHDSGSIVEVDSLEEFWKELSKVTLKGTRSGRKLAAG
jgi:hypothetical protein